MQVSAVGGVGAGGPAGGLTAVAGSAAGGATAASSIEGTFLQGTVPAGLEALSDAAQDIFGDTNLLFTLLILALLDKGDEEGGGAAGALGLLVGLALASHLGQALGNQPGQPFAESGGVPGVGGQLDVSA